MCRAGSCVHTQPHTCSCLDRHKSFVKRKLLIHIHLETLIAVEIEIILLILLFCHLEHFLPSRLVCALEM